MWQEENILTQNILSSIEKFMAFSSEVENFTLRFCSNRPILLEFHKTLLLFFHSSVLSIVCYL